MTAPTNRPSSHRQTPLATTCLLTALSVVLAAGTQDRASAANTARTDYSLTNPRVLFQTGFEDDQPTLEARQHKIVTGTARTGDRSLMGEVTEPNRARTFEIPLESARGKLVHVSFWVRSDHRSTCVTFAKVDGKRTRIGAKVDRIPVNRWQQVRVFHGVVDDTPGVIEIVTPSSYQAPAGKVWIDDLTVTETDDECRWPDHVEDFPALACDGAGQLWLAVLARPLPKRSIRVYRADGAQRTQVCTLQPENLTGIAAPAVAAFDKGCIVAFPAEQNERWRIAYAFVDATTPETVKCHYIPCEGNANISPAVAVIGNRACVVWESNAGNARGIYACWIDRNGAGPIERISASDANSYNPSIVALDGGSVFAAWDTIRSRSADIYGARFREGRWLPEQRITSAARVERHPHLAAWNSQLWMTWQAQTYLGRRLNNPNEQRIVVARIDGKRLLTPAGLFDQVSTRERLLVRPRIAFDSSGRLWLTARESIGQHAGWHPIAWCYANGTWSDPKLLLYQQGRWRPVNVTSTPAGPVAACQFDDIPQIGLQRGIIDDWKSGVAIKPLPQKDMPPPGKLQLEPLTMPETDFVLADRIDLASADLPRQRIQHTGQKLTLFWGDLHEHTDLSICARYMNPPGHDLFANVRDIEQLDFCALTDHGFDFDSPMWAYNGEQTRNNHDPGRFVTFLGLEWTSSRNPPAIAGAPNRYGHHNLMYLDPYYDRYHDAFDGDISPADLWEELAGVDFVCIPHQLADWQHEGKGNPPTDWNYVNPKLQPLAEIFQARESYEYLGCPRQAKHGAPFKGYYLQDAWAKGIVIGVIASPDHGGGMGKAGVWATDFTRKGIFEALRARHTFGTSGAKMALFLRAGDVMMGDEVKHPGGAITFHIRALAKHPIKELVIFRNNEIVHRTEPGQTELQLDWTDDAPPADKALWYYARIHAEDDELAWTSPIWVNP